MSDHYDDEDVLDIVRRASGLDETLREDRVIATTAGHVLTDSLTADAQAGRDLIEGQVHAGQDVLAGAGQAGRDYAGGLTRAVDDAAHGNVLAAPIDLVSGQVTATAHLAEAGLKGVRDLAAGELKAAGHLVEGAEHVGHDLLTGGAHLLGFGGDDKAGVLKKVGHESGRRVHRYEAEQKRDQAALEDFKRRLAGSDPHAVSSADQLLDAGRGGLHFFDYFLPAYNAWTGAGITMATIRQAYDRERGMSFAALAADAAAMSTAGDGAARVTQTLQQAYNALVPTWQGQAASQFETTMNGFFRADATVVQRFGDVSRGIDSAVVALQQLVYTKASTVSQLYAETLAPGIDGVQALRAMVGVARNDGVDDEYRRWVLGTLHQPMHGRHGWDQDNDMWSSDKLDDRSRVLAARVAAQWCDEVLAEQVGERLELFFQLCERTTESVQRLFASLTDGLKQLTDPFAQLPTTQPTDAPPTPTTPQGGVPGGGVPGGGVPGGGVPGGGVPGGGVPGGGFTGGLPASGLPPAGVTVPGYPTTGDPGAGVPTTGSPATTDPAATGPTAPVTNPDGSVTFGQHGELRIGPENPDGSFDLIETSGGATHDYRVVFGPNGRPVVLAVDGQATPPITSAPSPDGSVTAGNLTIGPDGGGKGFTLTHDAGSGAHGYQVSYDPAGHPHVGGGSGAAASFGGGTHLAGSDAAGVAPAGGEGSAQSSTGTTYGAAAPDAGTTMPAGSAPATASAGGGGHAGGPMGMPMMPMAGMGRGAGDQDLKRRYQPPPEDVVDAEDLEEWDRLGPTIG